MNILFVEYDPFTRNSKIWIKDETNKETCFEVYSTVGDLSYGIIENAYKNNIYDVKISGPSYIVQQISDIVGKYEIANYSNRSINIEGI